MAKPEPRSRDAAATRRALLDAARPLFAAHGYDATTVSRIAEAAGYSPNLVTRYFGGKEGLFLEATRASLDNDATLTYGAEDFGRRFADQVVDRWEREGQADPLLALMRSATSRPAAMEALGEFLESQSTVPLTRTLIALGLPEAVAADRANAIQSFVLGTVVTRRMMHTGAVAAAGSEQLRAWLADAFQRLLGPVPDDDADSHLPPTGGR